MQEISSMMQRQGQGVGVSLFAVWCTIRHKILHPFLPFILSLSYPPSLSPFPLLFLHPDYAEVIVAHSDLIRHWKGRTRSA